MNAATEAPKSGLDFVKWVAVIAVLTLLIVTNYYFEFSTLERTIGLVVAIPVAGFIAAQTAKGREFLLFAKEAKLEVRKVVWPTRQDTNKMTGIVAVATLFMAFVLFCLDWVLLKIVSFLTGLGI
jgi:preprotein translocase subunit SecE